GRVARVASLAGAIDPADDARPSLEGEAPESSRTASFAAANSATAAQSSRIRSARIACVLTSVTAPIRLSPAGSSAMLQPKTTIFRQARPHKAGLVRDLE